MIKLNPTKSSWDYNVTTTVASVHVSSTASRVGYSWFQRETLRFASIYPKSPELVVCEYMIGVTGTVLNIIALFLILTITDLRMEKSNMLVSSLLSANILLSLKLGLLYASSDHIPYSEKHCLIYASITVFTVSLSCFSRATIAIDRYNYICHPLHYEIKMTTMFVTLIMLFQWCISGALAVISYATIQRVKRFDSICLPFSECNSPMLSVIFATSLTGMILTYVYCKIFYWAYLQINLLKQEALVRATQRRSSINIMYRSALKLRRMTRATSLLLNLETKDSQGNFFNSLDQTAIEEEQRGKSKVLSNSLLQLGPVARILSYLPIKLHSDRSNSTCVDTFHLRTHQHIPAETTFDVHSEHCALEKKPINDKDQPLEHKINSTVSQKSGRTESLVSNVSLTEKWFQHELRRYTGKISQSIFFGSDKHRYSRNSVMLVTSLNRTETKALTMVLITFGAHLLCWLPYTIFASTLLITNLKLTGSQESVIMLVGYACSVIDPIVYCMLHQPFRHSVTTYFRHYRS